jgi:hypothetical protein
MDLGPIQGRVFSDREILDYEWLWPDLLEATRRPEHEALTYLEGAKFDKQRSLSKANPSLAKTLEEFWVTPIVPFEASPLELSSLKDIVVSGSGVAIGATLGFVVAAGTPFLWFTVPAGIVLCGGAVGLSKGLEKGIEAWLLKLMDVKKVNDSQNSTP